MTKKDYIKIARGSLPMARNTRNEFRGATCLYRAMYTELGTDWLRITSLYQAADDAQAHRIAVAAAPARFVLDELRACARSRSTHWVPIRTIYVRDTPQQPGAEAAAETNGEWERCGDEA